MSELMKRIRKILKPLSEGKPENVPSESEFVSIFDEGEDRAVAQQYYSEWAEQRQAELDGWMARTISQVHGLLKKIVSGESVLGERKWLNAEQAANHLDVEVRTIRDAASRGAIPGYKFPPNSAKGKWLFKEEDLDAAVMKGWKKPRGPQRKGLSIW